MVAPLALQIHQMNQQWTLKPLLVPPVPDQQVPMVPVRPDEFSKTEHMSRYGYYYSLQFIAVNNKVLSIFKKEAMNSEFSKCRGNQQREGKKFST